VRGQRHAPAAPYARERPGTHCTGGWVGLRAGLDRCGITRPTGIRSADHPARRQSLYRLRYPAHKLLGYGLKKKFNVSLNGRGKSCFSFLTQLPVHWETRLIPRGWNSWGVQMFIHLHLMRSLSFSAVTTPPLLDFCYILGLFCFTLKVEGARLSVTSVYIYET